MGSLGWWLGLAFWTNFLSLVFLPAVAVLAWRNKLHRLPGGLVAAAAAFILGSLPHWLYGLRHGTGLPPAGGWIAAPTLRDHVLLLGRVAWPILAGVPEPIRTQPSGLRLAAALGVVALLATTLALRAAWRHDQRRPAVALALTVLVATNVAVVVGTRYGERLDDADQKYFLPVYTAIPALVGAGLDTVPLGAGLPILVGLLLIQGIGDRSGALSGLGGGAITWRASQRQAFRNGVRDLDRLGLRALYTTNRDMSILAFLSREGVVFSTSYQESYPTYARAADGTARAGWWFGGRDADFEANLATIGARFAFHPVEPWGGVYTDFALPPERLRELDPRTFRLTASRNAEDAALAADRDAATFWTGGTPRREGEWLEVDLGRVEPVALVRWIPRVFQEVPSGIRLELSRDGIAWQRVIDLTHYRGPFYWSAGRPMNRVRSGRVELRVPPTPARFLRITQLGDEPFWGWSVRELFVYADDPSGAWIVPDGDVEALARAVHAAGVTRLYADAGWASRIALAHPEIRVLPANLSVDAYGYAPAADRLPTVRWEPGSGALVEGPDADGFEQTAGASNLRWTHRDVAGFRLFVYAPPPPLPGRPIATDDLHLSAAIHSEGAPRAADGRRHTRWTTGRADKPATGSGSIFGSCAGCVACACGRPIPTGRPASWRWRVPRTVPRSPPSRRSCTAPARWRGAASRGSATASTPFGWTSPRPSFVASGSRSAKAMRRSNGPSSNSSSTRTIPGEPARGRRGSTNRGGDARSVGGLRTVAHASTRTHREWRAKLPIHLWGGSLT